MRIFNRRLEASFGAELGLAGVLILLFSGFLSLNLWQGFSLPAYILVGSCGLLISIFYPRAGFFALTFLVLLWSQAFTLQSLLVGQQEFKFYLVDILFGGIIIGLWPRLLKRKYQLNLKTEDLFLLAFLLMTAFYFWLSMANWQGSFALAFSSFKNYAFYPLFYFVAYLLIDSRERLEAWLKVVVAGAVCIIGFIGFGLFTGKGAWTEITPLSTMGSRILDFNHAFYLCLIVIFGLMYVVFKKGQGARWLYILLPVFFIGIAGSLMRHLWIALFVALIALYFILPALKRHLFRQLVFSYGLITLFFGVIIFLLINIFPFSGLNHSVTGAWRQLSDRANSISDTKDTSIAWRGAVWQSVWDRYKNSLSTGIGFGQRIFIDMDGYLDYVEVKNVHNSWLAIFSQMGLVGFGLFVVFALCLWRKLFFYGSRNSSGQTAKFALLGIIIFCSVAFWFQPYLEANFFNIIWWLSLGLAKRTYEGSFG